MVARSDAACFVGIDLHKDTLTACTIAAKDREVSYRKIACVAREKVREFLAGLPRPSVVAIETVWAPPVTIQRVRNLTRHRVGLSRDHAKTLHRVKSIMNRLNRPGPGRMDAAGLQRYLLASVERIEADDLTVLWQHQRRLVEIEQDRSAIDRRIMELMGAEEFRRLRTILESIPGVGLVTAATAIAEIGDFSRFPDGKAIGRYAGFKKTWLKLSKTAGKKAAAVAIARKLLVLMWTLVRKDELYKAREPIAV